MKYSTLTKKNKGFALIATISVMVLLVMIALAMLSLSTIEVRQSRNASHQATAQANARMALMIAIGELQKNLGPDTRVSAPASLVSTKNQSWIGVWKTRPDEDPNREAGEDQHVIDHHKSEAYLNDIRSGSSNKPTAETWLVSHSLPIVPSDIIPAESRVTLLQTDQKETTVIVPSISIKSGTGRLAYWIGDQSQKALISQSDPYISKLASSLSAPSEAFYSLLGTQAPYLDNFKATTGEESFKGLSATEERSKLASYETASLLSLENPPTTKILKNHFHDFTVSSMGLYTNVMNGGLKSDLTAFLEGGDIADDAFLKLPALTNMTPIIPTANHAQTSPRYGALAEWSKLADKVNGDAESASITLQEPTRKTLALPAKWATGKERDITKVIKPAIQPIVVEASLGWDWSPYTVGEGSDNPVERLRAHVYPRLVLWNPFNVTLKAEKYALAIRIPTYGSFSYRNQRLTYDNHDRLWFHLYSSMPNGRPEKNMLGFITEETEIGPGQCLVFTPDVTHSLGTKLYGKAAKLNTQYYNYNILTSDQVPGVENFYVDTPVPLTTKETPANKYATYGYSLDKNSFYSNNDGSDLFMVAHAPSGGLSNVTWQKFQDYPRISHFIAQNSGLNSYSKWYDAEGSLHASNGGGYFREFKPGAPDVGALENRRQPRLWRRGIRVAWYNDRAESKTLPGTHSPARVSGPIISSTNLRGGLIHHNNWLEKDFSPGWMPTIYSSHIHYRQPPNPSDYESNFPPSPINDPAFGFPEKVCLYDVPRKKTGIISLAQFQHAQLSYLPWHPSYIIGHSLSTHTSDYENTALSSKVANTNRWKTGLGVRTPNFEPLLQSSSDLLMYDIAYEVNHRLWDNYFLSTIPYNSGKFSWDGKSKLPYSPCVALSSSSDLEDSFLNPSQADHSHAFHHSAAYLGNVGAFNVNSTSVHAWKAMLSSLNGKIRPSLDGAAGNADGYPFSRFVLPATAGNTSIGDVGEESAQSGFRVLTESEIEQLAEKIVLEVKKRGPFLSLSDFINRRLQSASSSYSAQTDYEDPSRMGTLQASIEAAGLNTSLRDDDGNNETFDDDATLNDTAIVPSHNARPAFKSYGLPGYLMQGDLLNTLAPRITVRGDTFVIRAYGETKGSNGKVLARAWCEATVQRTPEYVDKGNDPATPPRIQDSSGKMALNPDLLPLNRKFGRRIVITSFRWLSNKEI